MDQYFDPLDMQTRTIREVSPVFIAKFEFFNTELGPMRLEIEMMKNFGPYGDWTRKEIRWTKIPDPNIQHANAQTTPLELNVIRAHRYAFPQSLRD